MTTPHHPTDQQLVASCRAGEVSAFGAIVERYQNVVCAVAFAACGNRALSEDVAQEAFVTAWTDLDKLQEPKKLRGWLCSIARNKARDALRKRHREVLDEDPAGGETTSGPSPLDDVVAREDEETIWAALEEVPESCREPLVLFYREDKSIKQVASGLGITIAAAKKRLERGRQALKSSLDQVEAALAETRPSKAFTVGVIALVAAKSGVASAAAASAAKAASARSTVGAKIAGVAAVGLAVVVGGLWWSSRSSDRPNERTGESPERVVTTKRTPTRYSGPPIELEPTETPGPHRLEGRVVDVLHRPVSGATVTLSSHPPRTQTTDSSGQFFFDGLRTRTYGLEARSDSGTSRPTGVHVGPKTEPVILRIQQGSSAEIALIDAVTREPVAGAAAKLHTVLSTADYVSGEDGVVRIDGLGGALSYVEITADGYGPVEVDLTVSGEPGVTRRMVPLERGPPASGVVVDEAGEPIADAKVYVMTVPSDGRGTELKTDADGRWQIPTLSPAYYIVSVLHKEYVPTHTTLVAGRDPEQPVSVRTVLSTGASASGVVLFEGRPVSSAWVTAEFDDGPREVLTDDHGRFEIKGLPVTEMTIGARHGNLSSKTLALDVSKPVRDLELRLGDHSIRGIVVDATGEPVSGASVYGQIEMPEDDFSLVGPQLPEVSDFTGPTGEFVLSPLEPGKRYQLIAVADGVPELFLQIAPLDPVIEVAGTDGVRLVAGKPGGLHGTVRGADGAVPSEFAINLQQAEGYAIPLTTPFSETEGEFALRSVPPGTYKLTITGSGYAPLVMERVTVNPDRPTNLGELVLPAGTAIRGKVVSSRGEPVAGANVVAGDLFIGDGVRIAQDRAIGSDPLSVSGGPSFSAVSGPDGTFSISGAHTRFSLIVIVAQHPDGRSSPMQVVEVGPEIEVELTVSEPATLSGTVPGAGESRVPIDAVATPVLDPKPQGPASIFVVSVVDGRYRFAGLPSGSYDVFAQRADAQAPPRDDRMIRIELSPGKDRTLDLEISEAREGPPPRWDLP